VAVSEVAYQVGVRGPPWWTVRTAVWGDRRAVQGGPLESGPCAGSEFGGPGATPRRADGALVNLSERVVPVRLPMGAAVSLSG